MARVNFVLGVLVAALAVATPGWAQTRPAISLDEAIRRAELVQPRVISAIGALGQADARVRSAKGAWLPDLSLSSSASNFYSEGQRLDQATGQIVPSNSSNNSINGSVSSSIELFDGFRRSAQSKAAKAGRDAASESLDDARFQQALATTNQYFDVLAALQLSRVSEASVRRAEEQLNVSIARLRAGAAIRSDSLRSLVTLGTARIQLINAQTQQATAEANLGRLVGADGPVTAVEDSTYFRVMTDLDTAALRVEALNRSPQVRAAEASAAAARASVGVARAGYWPTLSLSGSVSLSGSQSNDYDFRQQRRLQLGVSWNVFNGFQREENIASQRYAAETADASAGETRRLVQANLTTRLAELSAAEVRIRIARTSLAAATEDLRVQQERYRLGVATIVDVLTSQEALAQAEVDEVTARFDLLRAKAQIEALIGRHL